MGYLETVPVENRLQAQPFRCRCNGSTARTSISAASPAPSPAARIAPGGDRVALPSGAKARWRASSPPMATSPQAVAGQAVTLTLADESTFRAAMSRHRSPAGVADQFQRTVVWMERRAPAARAGLSDEDLRARSRCRRSREIKHKVDVNTMEHLAAKHLELNEIGVCNLTSTSRSPSPYAKNRATRRFHPDRPHQTNAPSAPAC
jgi:bifunctional enzyme CysN/CysC